MKLYYHPLSTYCQKTLIAFYEKSVEFTPKIVSLADKAERDAYRNLYSMGKIPLLLLDDGQLVPESSIIVEYLDTHSRSARKLIPDDPDLARQVRLSDRLYDLYLNEPVTLLVVQSRKPETRRNQKLIERSRFRVRVMLEFMESQLNQSTWTNGEMFTLSDCAAVPPLVYSGDAAPLDKYPNVAAYWRRLQERPSIHRVLDEAGPYLAEQRSSDA